MRINKNLVNTQVYPVEIFNEGIKRCHANESKGPILPQEVLVENILKTLNIYPDKIYQELTIQASEFYNIDSDFTIPTNGSDEGIDLIIRTFCAPEDKVILLSPTFSMYKRYAVAFGLRTLQFNLDDEFELKTDHFIDFCRLNSPRIVFIPNPLAPTGGIVRKDSIIKIAKSLPDTLIVIDEAYIEFSGEKSITDLLSKYHNLIAIRTVSKFFGLAGIRLGFVFTKYKNDIMKIKSPYNVNQVSCQIGINLFQNLTTKIIQNRYDQNIVSKEKTISWLLQFNEIKKIYPSYANFLFIHLNCNSKKFEDRMLNDFNTKIKSFSGEFENFCRISCQ